MKKYFILILLFSFSHKILWANKKEKEPKFKSVYFTNAKGDSISSISISEKFVYLVVVSKNAKGEKASIKITEEDEDEFIYKKQYLTLGSKISFRIRKDIQKIKIHLFHSHNKRHQQLKQKALNEQNSTK